ncbi:MAG: hypothetical protein MZW92_06735 [Comamonadaceae bacterium]|nr:hypothetical protein [Comamonadaceae bacterium]
MNILTKGKEHTMMAKLVMAGIAVFFIISTGLATELFGPHPSGDFLNAPWR